MPEEVHDTSLLVLTTAAERRAQMEREVRAGLSATPKSLPPKYFYDERGSALFDAITKLPEYYPTRAETEILEAHAYDLAAAVRPSALVELGSGYSRKTRLLIESMREYGGTRYVAFDVSEDAIVAAAEHLAPDYPWLRVDGVVGDFEHHLGRVEREGHALVAFLGSTIGNFHPDDRVPFLREVRGMMFSDDRFLMGMDLVKDTATLEAAYNDSQGVTADFNQNVLRVLNRDLDADFDVEAFEHRAFFDTENAWIEMRLRATSAQDVRVAGLDLDLSFEAGEELRTELSCKFTRETATAALEAAGLRLERWMTDPAGRFALALSAPA